MRIRLCEATIQDIDRKYGNNIRVQRSKGYTVRMKEFITDPLYITFEVTGGRKPYEVELAFEGVAPKTVTAMKNSIKNSQIRISCDCPDATYRFNYVQGKNGFGLNTEHRPANIRNPKDNLGPGCKHIAAVVKNQKWIYQLASEMKKRENEQKGDSK